MQSFQIVFNIKESECCEQEQRKLIQCDIKCGQGPIYEYTYTVYVLVLVCVVIFSRQKGIVGNSMHRIVIILKQSLCLHLNGIYNRLANVFMCVCSRFSGSSSKIMSFSRTHTYNELESLIGSVVFSIEMRNRIPSGFLFN